MSSNIVFSCIIPAKSLDDPKLKDLLTSIRAQDFQQDQIETIVVTEGDSEQAKTIGIRKAKGEICAMFCADNYLINKNVFRNVEKMFRTCINLTGVYSGFYAVINVDNSLNRYFSLIGNNDPICFYLGKCDRKPLYELDEEEFETTFCFERYFPSLGDNGFFFRRSHLLESKLDHYYPMDVCVDMASKGFCVYKRVNFAYLWHRTTDGNLIKFLIKRYKYARDLYCERNDRRWKMLDTRQDYLRLAYFILCTLTILPCLMVSLRGYVKVKDKAWAWHPIVCLGFLITYGILVCRNILKSVSSFLLSVVKNVFPSVSKASNLSPSKTMR